jgi:hypothetical protein
MEMPPLLSSRPQETQLVLAIAVPAVFGIVTGIALGVSEPAYLLLSILGIGGGFFAGFEHRGAAEGAIRGFAGGLLFGTFIIATHVFSGMDAKAKLPHPQGLLIVITTLFGIGLAAWGGSRRAKRMRGTADPLATQDVPAAP